MGNDLAHQAGALAIGPVAVLVEGPPGSGKSSLALALIDRGAQLIGDDGVLLEAEGDRLLASPHPVIAGKLEVRNVGIIDLPTRARVPVGLVLVLDEAAPRFIEQAEATVRGGVTLPLVRLHPASPVLALRAEQALRIHGRSF